MTTAIAAATAAAGLARTEPAIAAGPTAVTTGPVAPVLLRWLEGTPSTVAGATGTVCWARGALQPGTSLRLTDSGGSPVASQSSPLAYWPDGSVKWTMHVIPPTDKPAEHYSVAAGESLSPAKPIVISESVDSIQIDTGIIQCILPRTGAVLIDKMVRNNRPTLMRGQLVCHLQNAPEGGSVDSCQSLLQSVSIESAGPVSTVVRVEGSHQGPAQRAVLPFIVRLYFTAGSDEIRMVHTFIYDLDEKKDFVRGIGVRFDVPMNDPLYDRHIRLTGESEGLFAEAIQGITGLRRDPGLAARKAQIDGIAAPPLNEWESNVASHLKYVPAWGDYTLSQLCADGFQIRKRTRAGFGWIAAGAGKRSSGSGYVGGASGGVAFGMRDFWQKHPAQIDIRDAGTDLAQVTLWLWAPDAPAMDLRFYHDGMGEDDYVKQTEALDTTYEDYEPGYASPFGIARTSEMAMKVLPGTPSRQAMVDFARAVQTPPVLVCEAQRYLDADVFGGLWTLPDRSTPARALIEDELSFFIDRYLNEVDQRSWYGFWDYGDVRHTQDTDRHVWRYDVGGFAWDNSELSTDLWLWYSWLRTGRADLFRMAEAMTRHTGEVDVYHMGPRKGLGTRHGVQHWGDSSKQTRISSALYRRPYYFLTGDLRVGQLMRDQVGENETWLTNNVERKLPGNPPFKPTREAAPWGAMAWGELMAAWFTEVERTQNKELRDKILASMKSITELKHGFFSDHATMNIDTGVVSCDTSEIYLEHLTAVFGLPEICCELVKTYGSEVPAFADAWALYGELYNATPAQRTRVLGSPGKRGSMGDTYSRCTAFAAWHRQDAGLAKRAWNEWLDSRTPQTRKAAMRIKHVSGPDVLNPIDEAVMSTNNAAQYSLASMQLLALVPDGANSAI